MAKVTSIQRREPRSNQSGNYADFDLAYEVDRLTVSVDSQNNITVLFRTLGDHSLGVGLRMPREWSRIVSSIIDAVDGGAGTIGVELPE